jgi:Zn-dependent peptidase ImmA (M78 family)
MRSYGDKESQMRERAIHRYIVSLDKGDAEGVAAVLQAALDDPELDRLISEVDLAYQEEESLTPTSDDSRLVRRLAWEHFASAFEAEGAEAEPLKVKDVVARLEADRRLAPEDQAASQSLRNVEVPLPKRLGRREVNRLREGLGGEASDRFWRAFRDAAIMMELGRAGSLGQLAAREEARRGGRRGRGAVPKDPHHGGSAAEFCAPKDEDPAGNIKAVERVYREAGIEVAGAKIVQVHDLIATYPLTVHEVKDLTFDSAAKFLSSKTGQSISFSKRHQHDDRPLAGFLYTQGHHGCVLVKKNAPFVRQRFSAAHELGHYVRHFLPILERQDPDTAVPEDLTLVEGLSYSEEESSEGLPTGRPTLGRASEPRDFSPAGDTEQLEREANEFAAELLMPARACEELVKRFGPLYGWKLPVLSRRLANELLVSQSAMRLRLSELGLFDG